MLRSAVRTARLLRTVLVLTVLVPAGLMAGTASAADVVTSDANDGAVVAPRLASAREVAKATPGDFTGYGFDQCLAPTQQAMDAWWRHSPFTAVGIYIS